jgi:predicted CopG family antitoxin
MPTENEVKVVLSCGDPEAALVELKGRNRFSHVIQGYLERGETTCRVRFISTSDGARFHKLTVKREVNKRLIEIETEIDERDFNDLWTVCKGKIHKVRVYVEDWEIDFFLDQEGVIYFVLAEHEMPEGQEDPTSLTGFVRDHLLYEVPRGDKRFSNRKLGKVKYARELFQELKKGS